MFFVSWALWEQMTFVLGAAILVVFAIGYGKLLYTNRLLQKQEVVDEEKRIRIRELRNSGQIVDSRRSHDVPFGVRAIQSGIQVDGIWISQGSTPIPSDLKLDHLRTSSTEIDTSRLSNEITSDPPRTLSRQGKPAFRATHTPNSNLDKLHDASDTQRPMSAGTRASYKPRKSSYLSHASHGQYDEETLSHLEGKPPGSKREIQTHRPHCSRQIEADSSAADNERSSTGTSSDSEASLSNKLKQDASSYSQSLLHQPDARDAPSMTFSSVPKAESLPSPASKGEYFSIPIESPQLESANPFESPLLSSVETTPGASPILGLESSGDYHAAPSPSSRSMSPFVPGELHVNKTVRKVNSGFEVLPAGTFGVPPEFRGRGLDIGGEDHVGERKQSKLQKKTRISMTGRISSTFERP